MSQSDESSNTSLQIAITFLKLFCEPPYNFRTFDDSKDKNPKLTREFFGTLEQHAEELFNLNEQGAGIYFIPNVCNGARGRDVDVIAVRANYIDNDEGIPSSYHLQPTLIVNSSPRKNHAYWLHQAHDSDLSVFKSNQQKLVDYYGSDKQVVNLSRVMRLPGFNHNKTATPHLVTFELINEGARYTVEEIMSLPPVDAFTRDLDKYCNKLSNQTEGGRNALLNEITYTLAGKYPDKRDEVYAALGKAASECGLGNSEFETTFESGWNAGSAKPIEKKSRQVAQTEKDEEISIQQLLAEIISDEHKGRLTYCDSIKAWMHCGSSNVWKALSEESLESLAHKLAIANGLRKISASTISGAVRLAKHMLFEDEWSEKPPNECLPFLNGLLDLTTQKLKPLTPEDKVTWQLPRNYDITKNNWSETDKFLMHLSGGNQKLKHILCCYCNAILKGRPDLQKFLHLIGFGGTGKGTFINLATALVGERNTVTSDIHSWCNNRFETINAFQKRLLVFPDEDQKVGNLQNFAKVVGQDLLRGEGKGKPIFSFYFMGMVILASNAPIFFSEAGDKIRRRAITFPCNNIVKGKPNTRLIEFLKAELPAFTNYVLSIPDEEVEATLMGTDSVPETVFEAWESKIRVDSISAFVNDCCIKDPKSMTPIGGQRVAFGGFDEKTLWSEYNRFCDDSGMKPKSLNNFSKELLDICSLSLKWDAEKRRTKNGMVLTGVRLRNKLSDVDIHTVSECLSLQMQTNGLHHVDLDVDLKSSLSKGGVDGVDLSLFSRDLDKERVNQYVNVGGEREDNEPKKKL